MPEPIDLSSVPLPGDAIENVAEEEQAGVIASFLNDPTVLPATVAQQIFSIVPGIAGGLAGFILASKLANTRRVKTKGVVIAAVANALLTMLTIFLIVEADEIQGE